MKLPGSIVPPNNRQVNSAHSKTLCMKNYIALALSILMLPDSNAQKAKAPGQEH